MGDDINDTVTSMMAGLTQRDDVQFNIDELKASLTEEMKNQYDLLETLCDYCKPTQAEEKDKGKPVDDVKDVAALKKFQNSPIAGHILIHHDFEKLFDILKGMSIGTTLSSGGKGKEEKEPKGPKKKLDFIGKLKEAGQDVLIFFKSILQVALMAPPLLILLPVLAASTLLLSGFLKTVKKSILPNLPNKKDSSKAAEFGPTMKSIFTGVKELAKSVLILPLIAIPLALSIPLLPLIQLFTKGMGGVSKTASSEQKSFKKSILSFVFLASSLLILGVGVFLAAKMGVNMKPAIKAVAFAAILMGGLIILGALAGFAKWGILAIGVASFLMAASFLMMSLALKILFNMEKTFNFKKLIGALASILIITVAVGIIGVAALLALVPCLALLVFSVALLISFAALWVSLKLLNVISGMMGDVDSGLDAIQNFIHKFAENINDYLLGAAAGLALLVFSASLLIGSALFLVSLGVLWLIGKLGNKPEIEKGKEDIIGFAKEFGNKEIVKTFGLAAAGAIAMAVFGAGFLIGALALWGAMKAVEKIVEISQKLGGANTNLSPLKAAYDYSVGALYQFTLGKQPGKEGIKASDLLEGAKNCAKLAALAVEMGLYTVPMALAFSSLALVFESLEKLQSSVDKIGGKENVDKILSSVGVIFESMATTAESFKGMSAKAINAIGSLVKDVAESIGMLADTMIKIKDGIKEEEIEGATNKIKLMCLKMFGDGETDDGTFTLTKLFKTLSNSKLKKLRADSVESLLPIIQSISLLADTVVKMGDPEIFSEARINAGINNFQKVSGLFSEFTNLCTGLTQRQSGSTLFSKIFGDKSPLQALKDLVEQDFFGAVTEAVDGFNMAGEQLSNLNIDGMKPVIEFFGAQSKFFSEWIATSGNFARGMKDIGSGLGHLKQKDVETFNNFLVTLKTGGNGISVAVQSLIEFANKASDFASIAKSFSSMSDSLNKISKNKNGFLDIMKSANKNKNVENVQAVTNQGKTGEEKILEKLSNLETILESFVPSSNLGHAPGKGIMVYSVDNKATADAIPNLYETLGGNS